MSKAFQIKATCAAMMWLCVSVTTTMVTNSIAEADDHYLVVFDNTDTLTIRIGLPTQLTLRSGTYGDSKSARLEESLRRRLDFNHDQTLDFGELSRGEQLLKTLDYDEDESLSPLEIEPHLLAAGKETARLNKPFVMHIRSCDDAALLASELARLGRAEEDPLATVDVTLKEADDLDRAICVVANEASIAQVRRFKLNGKKSARWILSKGRSRHRFGN